MYRICLTNETPVSQFKESDIVLARPQQAQWQQNTSLHCWCLHQESHIKSKLGNQSIWVHKNCRQLQQWINFRTYTHLA